MHIYSHDDLGALGLDFFHFDLIMVLVDFYFADAALLPRI